MSTRPDELLVDAAGQIPAHLAPQSETKRVEKDGFARAGLAGQDIETGAEVEIEALDQDDVADREGTQHWLARLSPDHNHLPWITRR